MTTASLINLGKGQDPIKMWRQPKIMTNKDQRRADLSGLREQQIDKCLLTRRVERRYTGIQFSQRAYTTFVVSLSVFGQALAARCALE